jgi:hypothetical protein
MVVAQAVSESGQKVFAVAERSIDSLWRRIGT